MSTVQRNPLLFSILLVIALLTLISMLTASSILQHDVTRSHVFVTSTDYYEAATTATYVTSLTHMENIVQTMVASTP